nr:hypothetical protein [uncultured bacterium]
MRILLANGLDTSTRNLPRGDAPHPTLTAAGVTWLYGYDFEIKVIASLTA